MEASELECCLTVENLNSNGIVMKRRTFKSITVVLDRDEFREFAQSKQNGISSNWRRLLSDKAGSFENINPLTDKDFTVGCKKF